MTTAYDHLDPLTVDPDRAERMATGAAFVFGDDEDDAAIWGCGEAVAWAAGESIMLYSAPGTGKTTLAGLLVRGRLGLEREVLGWPIAEGKRRVLYLAQDRPRQIARALRRQFHESERDVLADRLRVWRGPLLEDLTRNPRLLAELAAEAGADTIVIDSIKDAATRLAEDEGGRSYNVARQHALAEGIEVLELHHARKATSEGRRGLSIDDVYGSTWLVAGAGSVLGLIGDANDTTIELRGMRTPRGEISMQVHVDREAGTMRAARSLTVLEALSGQGSLLAKAVAQIVHGRDEVSKAETERARRELDALADRNRIERVQVASVRGGRDRVAYRSLEEA